MKILIAIALGLAATHAAAGESFASSLPAAAPASAAMYSFVDVYRLTVSGAAKSGLPLAAGAESAVRVAVSQGSLAPEAQFSVVSIAEPQRWMLLLAGLSAAFWVARRRLGYFF